MTEISYVRALLYADWGAGERKLFGYAQGVQATKGDKTRHFYHFLGFVPEERIGIHETLEAPNFKFSCIGLLQIRT